tara:strand:- start:50 stop:1402 length:1353 start_codon:yes stop_codon:yes gene_type:complete
MEDNMTTPTEMRLSEVPGMPSPAMDLTYTTSIPINGNTFTENQEVRIALQCPTNGFVDLKRAYLKFKINNTGAGSAFLDPLAGGAAVIDTLRITGGNGALLEEVIHYNALYAVMNANKNKDVVSSIHNVYEGASTEPAVALKVNANNSDAEMAGCVSITNAQSRVITHRPQSAFFNADRYMPLGYSQGLVNLSFTLAQNATAFILSEEKKDNASSYTISDVELHLPILQPGPEFAAMFRSAMSSGVPIQIHSVGIQNTQQALATSATGPQTLTFSTRKRSVKSVMTAMRPSANLTVDERASVSGFVNADCSAFNYSIGGMRVPASQIKVEVAINGRDQGALLANQQLALGHFSSDLRGICCVHNDEQTYLPESAEHNDKCSKCVFALDLESYNAAFAGKNLSGAGLPLVLHATVNGTNGAQANGALLLDLYIIHDVVYVMDSNGIINANS